MPRSNGIVPAWVGRAFQSAAGDSQFPDNAIDGATHRAAAAVKEWPKEDLFPQFAN
jgi:hypothetical protein